MSVALENAVSLTRRSAARERPLHLPKLAAIFRRPWICHRDGQIARHARDLLNADDSAIYLPDPTGKIMQAIVAIGDTAEEIKADPIHLGEGIIGSLSKSAGRIHKRYK